MDLKVYIREKKGVVDEALEKFLPEHRGPAADVVEAMRYSLFAGGKRLRPILCLAAAQAVGGDESRVLPVACALELIHTYSLIHDDLPVMDDDDLRRGKPTNHKVYGEAVALLAGDGLLTEAFRLMTDMGGLDGEEAVRRLKVIEIVATAAGYQGMVGGQVVDIQSEGGEVSLPLVQFIHRHKTAALLTASVTAGGILGGGIEDQISALNLYGQHIGLAFQISDDILDIEGDSRKMGKSAGSDERKGKLTYPSVLGLDKSKDIQEEMIDSAIGALKGFDREAEPLRQIARYIIERNR
jgi:geranylgeranyl diphosphate synthase type II